MWRQPLVLALILLSGCAAARDGWNQLTAKVNPPPESTTESTIAHVEKTHGNRAWRAKRSVSADVLLVIDEKLTEAKMTFTTDGSETSVEPVNGRNHAPAQLSLCPFFTALPFMLRDAGVFIADAGTLRLGGLDRPVLRMTFDPQTGHSPSDWCILYPDPETGRLRAMAYLFVREGIDARPRALVYTDFEAIGGVVLATRWTFYNWSESGGITGDPIGRCTLKNIRFDDAPPATQP